MIMVGRSLVCGPHGGAQSPVSGPGAGRVPERRNERAGAEAGVRSGRCLAPEQLEQGRSSKPWFEHQIERIDELRDRAAALLGATAADVALTGSTTDGINAVLHALDLRPGDEILTSDEEHPGVLGPVATARDTCGVSVRVVPFAELPGEVRPETRLVVTSHVSWATGRVMDMAPLAASDALVALDGAQGLGAVPSTCARSAATSTRPRGRSGSAGRAGSATCTPTPSWCPRCPRPGAATTR